MLEAFLSLPYVHVWLPLIAAVLIGTPVYLLTLRASRPGAMGLSTAPPVEQSSGDDPFALGSTGEQRKAFRRLGNPIEVHYTADAFADAPRSGYVIDRSVGGLRLMVTHEVPPGTVLSVRPANVSPMVPWVELEARSCANSATQPGAYDVGCAFVKTPPYSILLLFG